MLKINPFFGQSSLTRHLNDLCDSVGLTKSQLKLKFFIKFIEIHHKHFQSKHNKAQFFLHAKRDIKNNLSLQTIFQTKPTELQKSCSCLVKEDCAMNGLCLILSILYQATIKHNDSKYKKKKKNKYN